VVSLSSQRIVLVAIAAFILAVPLLTDSLYILNLFILSGIAVMLAMSNHLIVKAGLWFLGHIAFLAMGTFFVIYSRQYLGFNYWLALPLAGLFAAGVALGLGYATANVKGMPFCILTVAFVEVVRLTIKRLAYGRPTFCPPPERIFTIDFSSRVHYYYFMCALVALVLIILRLIDRSQVGANLKVISESESLAESIGINTVRYRVMVMTVGCGLAGLVGAFFAPYYQVIGETSFGFMPSIIIVMGIVVGGQYSFFGPVIGAVFLAVLPEFMPGHKATHQFIIYAVIVIATLFFLPKGLISLPEVIRRRFTAQPNGSKGNNLGAP